MECFTFPFYFPFDEYPSLFVIKGGLFFGISPLFFFLYIFVA